MILSHNVWYHPGFILNILDEGEQKTGTIQGKAINVKQEYEELNKIISYIVRIEK